MRYSPEEKMEIIRMVDGSELGVKRTLQELGIARSTFYSWYEKYLNDEPLEKQTRASYWNRIPDEYKAKVIETALELTHLSPREIATHMTDHSGHFISESSVYRILKRAGLITSPAHILLAAEKEFSNKTTRVHQMWQTDFTYMKIQGWGWYYLSTVLDDFSRFIVHWELCKSMGTNDVERTINHALRKAGLSRKQRPTLLSDNGPCYVSDDLKKFLGEQEIEHVRGRPFHPQTQGKIERYHRTMKNVVKLEHYYLPQELEYRMAEFVEYYNTKRYHESLQNCTPEDVYLGRQYQILERRKRIKRKSMQKRRRNHRLEMIKV